MKINKRLSLLRKKTKLLITLHKSKTGIVKQVLNQFSENIELRTIDIRFLELTKSLLVYQGVLENDLQEIKEELELIKIQVNGNKCTKE